MKKVDSTLKPQTRFLSDMSLRELVDNIGESVITVDSDENILIGEHKGIIISTRKENDDEIIGITVRVGKEVIEWREHWRNAVFAPST